MYIYTHKLFSAEKKVVLAALSGKVIDLGSGKHKNQGNRLWDGYTSIYNMMHYLPNGERGTLGESSQGYEIMHTIEWFLGSSRDETATNAEG
ncbi:hypothetical protein PABG_11105 [Paracoccidioides brasiliensis Pb03]|nr:hypothetical protein PABG_11105 [Paracoccidioides brasiliensis Pb03]